MTKVFDFIEKAYFAAKRVVVYLLRRMDHGLRVAGEFIREKTGK